MERLAERHEALAESVVWIAHGHQVVQATRKQAGQTILRFADAITHWTRIVHAPEQRLETLEGGA